MSEPKVFISYSRDDAEWVRKFAEALRDQHVNVWFDDWQVKLGESLQDAIEAGLRSSDAIVSILSAENPRRPATLFELGVAVGMGKRLIPIVPPGMDSATMPFELRNRQYLVKAGPAEAAQKVAEALKGNAA